MFQSMFTYNASALAVGGTFIQEQEDGRPGRVVVPSLASVALSPSGGEGSTLIEGYNCNGVSFARAESRVVGYSRNAREYVTHSDVFITDLNIFGRLTIALLQANVVSTHHIEEEDSKFVLQATYRNIEFDGKEVLPLLDVDLVENCPTYTQFNQHVAAKLPHYADRFGLKQADLDAMLTRTNKVPLRASLTKEIEYRDKKTMAKELAPRRAHGLKVPGLGKANFAEYQVKPGRRRITLLRLDLEPQASRKPRAFGEIEESFGSRMLKRARENGELPPQPQHMLMNGAPPPPPPDEDQDLNDLAAIGGLGDFSIASVDGNGSPPWKP